MTQINNLKKEQTILKQVLSLMNNNIEGKDDIKILLNHYINTNDTVIKEVEKPKLTPDEENLIKYRKLEKDYIKARDDAFGYIIKCAGDWGVFSNLTPEQKIKHNELEKIQNDIREEITRMEENELNKPKTIKINNKSYIVANSYGSNRGWGEPSRCIIVGETEKMYKIQFVPSKFDGWDKQQTSHYHYEYPTALNDKFTNKGKKTVKALKIYDDDTYETLCD